MNGSGVRVGVGGRGVSDGVSVGGGVGVLVGSVVSVTLIVGISLCGCSTERIPHPHIENGMSITKIIIVTRFEPFIGNIIFTSRAIITNISSSGYFG
jgi:hypothetical protein